MLLGFGRLVPSPKQAALLSGHEKMLVVCAWALEFAVLLCTGAAARGFCWDQKDCAAKA